VAVPPFFACEHTQAIANSKADGINFVAAMKSVRCFTTVTCILFSSIRTKNCIERFFAGTNALGLSDNWRSGILHLSSIFEELGKRVKLALRFAPGRKSSAKPQLPCACRDGHDWPHSFDPNVGNRKQHHNRCEDAL